MGMSAGGGKVIHGILVAGATVTWSRTGRKNAGRAGNLVAQTYISKYLYLLTCS